MEFASSAVLTLVAQNTNRGTLFRRLREFRQLLAKQAMVRIGEEVRRDREVIPDQDAQVPQNLGEYR